MESGEFESDNCSSVHPRVMQALMDVNCGHVPGYGYDPVTAEADRIFNHLFDRETDVFLPLMERERTVRPLRIWSRPGRVSCVQTVHILILLKQERRNALQMQSLFLFLL